MGHFSGHVSAPRYFRCSKHVQDTCPQLKGQPRPRPGLPFISQRLPAPKAAGAAVGPSAHVTRTQFTDGSQARLAPQNTRVTGTARVLFCTCRPAGAPCPSAAWHSGVLPQAGPSHTAPAPPPSGRAAPRVQGGPEQDSTATSGGQGGPHPAPPRSRSRDPAPKDPPPPGPAEPSTPPERCTRRSGVPAREHSWGGPVVHSPEEAASEQPGQSPRVPLSAGGRAWPRVGSLVTSARDPGSTVPADKPSVSTGRPPHPLTPHAGPPQAGRHLPTRRCSKDLKT